MEEIYRWLAANAVNQAACFLESVLILICIHTVYQEKLRLSGREMLLVTGNLAILALVNSGVAASWLSAGIYGMCFLYCRRKFKRKFLETLGKLVLGLLLAGFIEIVSSIAIIPAENGFAQKDRLMLAINLTGVLLAFLLSEIVKLRKKKIHLRFDKEEWGMLITIGIFYLGITIVDYRIRGEADRIYYLLFFAACLLVWITTIGKQEAKHELEKKMLEMEMQEVYGEIYEQLILEVRRRQHDYKNQLTAIYSMHLTATSLEELIEKQRSYGNILFKESRYDKLLSECNNRFYAGYLYCIFAAFESEQIEVDYQVSVKKANCRLAMYEVIEILGILLTNASEKVSEEKEERNIGFVLQETEENLLIEVGNKAQEVNSKQIKQMFEEGYSTKGESRGLGLSRVKKLTDKAGADLIVDNQMRGNRNWILFRILIPKEKGR